MLARIGGKMRMLEMVSSPAAPAIFIVLTPSDSMRQNMTFSIPLPTWPLFRLWDHSVGETWYGLRVNRLARN